MRMDMVDLNRRQMTASLIAGTAGTALISPAYASFDHDAVIAAAAKILREKYVDPDVAEQLAAMLETNNKNGDYATLSSPVSFAQRLTADLRGATRDLHMSVNYASTVPEADNAALMAEDDLAPRTTGYGVQTV